MANRFEVWKKQKIAEIEERFSDDPAQIACRLKFLASLPEMKRGQTWTDELFAYKLALTEHICETDLFSFDLVKYSSQELWSLIKDYQNKTKDDFCTGSRNIRGYHNLSRKYACRYPRYCGIALFGYQLPWPENIETLLRLADGRQILEIGAGRALWARFLSERGGDIVCTDDHSWNTSTNSLDVTPFYPVESLDWQSAVEKYSKAGLLLMIWPPLGKKGVSPSGLLDAVKAFQGTDIVLVGEIGDLTGGYELYNYLTDVWCEKETCAGNQAGHYDTYHVFNPWGFTMLGMFHWKKEKIVIRPDYSDFSSDSEEV